MSLREENLENIYELSPLQQVMLFHTLFAPTSGFYFEQISFTWRGALNLAALKRAWQQVVDHHAVLRTSFYWEDLDKPLQIVRRRATIPFEEQDWRGLTPDVQQRRLKEFLAEERRRGFDLSEAPLMRIACLRTGADHYQFVWSFHHLLLDGWSVQLVTRDVSTCYEALSQNRVAELPPSRPYGDYITWIQQQNLAEAEAFWHASLQGINAPTRLVLERPAAGSNSAEDPYDAREIRVPPSTTAALQSLARAHRLTLNTVVQGAWAVLLSRYAGEEDVIFGEIASGRPASLKGVEAMVGLFINTLPVRVRVAPDASVLAWLGELQARQVEARKYEYVNLVQLQGWSDVPRGTLLFENVVVFENFPMEDSLRAGRDGRSRVLHFERTNLPLTLTVVPGEEILIRAQYDRGEFDAASIERLLRHLHVLLRGFASDPARRLSELPLLPEAERRQLLYEWNATAKDYDWQQSVAGLFEQQAAQRPHAPAFIAGGEVLTYAELNRRANRLARHLRGLGVGAETVVAVCLERSFEAAVALLAVLKAGGVYCPLDPSYPAERLAYMLADSRARVLVTRAREASALPPHEARTVLLDAHREEIARHDAEDMASHVQLKNLAYLIYTSGSTGRPKGVAVEHATLLNRLYWMWEEYPFAAGEVCCQKTALSFVDALWELLGGLLRGVPTVILPDETVKDPRELVRALHDGRVTRLWLVPSLLQMLLDYYPDLQTRLPRLKFWVTSGEALSYELYRRFREALPASTLYNLYGTSEVWDATWNDPRLVSEPPQSAPIGRPISNVDIYVLDVAGGVVPLGVAGHLHVGGRGLARGYLHRPHLTAERFRPHPFSRTPGERLYRTGDVVRWRSGGVLEYVGRADYQVKIRGHRIEPGEVEALLAQHPAVRAAAVLAVNGNGAGAADVRLAAYVALADGAHIGDVRDYARARLPEYMMPAAWMEMERMPLSPNGKLDRRALPPLEMSRVERRGDVDESDAPHTPLEEALAEIYKEVLKVERVGVEDHFFAVLGGHSMLATQLMSRVRDKLGVELPLRKFFDAPTIASLAAEVSRAQQGESKAVSAPAITRLSREQRRLQPPGQTD